MRLNLALAVASAASMALSACSQEAAEPPVAPPAAPAPQAPTAPPVSYACESGHSITAVYPDTATARIGYRGQTYELRTAPTGSGARYVGSGMEWRTATRDGAESAMLSRLGPNEEVGTAVLERCSRPAATVEPTGPAPTDPVSPTPAAAPPCRGPQLRLTREGGDAGAGNRVADIGVQNIGSTACSLTGYPGVTLQDDRGRNLTTIRSEQSPGTYFTPGQPIVPVVLEPQARAAFELAWNVVPHEGQGETVCPSAARIRVTAPGDTSPATLDLPLTPCGGRVRVSPVRPTVAPGAPAT